MVCCLRNTPRASVKRKDWLEKSGRHSSLITKLSVNLVSNVRDVTGHIQSLGRSDPAHTWGSTRFGYPSGSAATKLAFTSLRLKLPAYRVGPDGDLHDPEHVWTQKMGVSPDGAVLVRPDGFVAWRSSSATTTPVQVLEQVMNRVLCRSATPATA